MCGSVCMCADLAVCVRMLTWQCVTCTRADLAVCTCLRVLQFASWLSKCMQ